MRLFHIAMESSVVQNEISRAVAVYGDDITMIQNTADDCQTMIRCFSELSLKISELKTADLNSFLGFKIVGAAQKTEQDKTDIVTHRF